MVLHPCYDMPGTDPAYRARPGRALGLAKFLDYVQSFKQEARPTLALYLSFFLSYCFFFRLFLWRGVEWAACQTADCLTLVGVGVGVCTVGVHCRC